MSDERVASDESASYNTVDKPFASHHTVNHRAGEYKRNGAGTNLAEGYFSELKRSLDGTHHHVSRVHLDRYLANLGLHVLAVPLD